MADDLLGGLRATLAPYNGHARDPEVVAKRFGLGGPSDKLSASQWKRLNEAIEAWSDKLVRASRLYPSQAYKQGRTQTMRFLHLLGLGPVEMVPASDRSAVAWLNQAFQHELTGTLARYKDEIRSAVLYGLQHGTGPNEVAALLFKATQDANQDWRRVAQTEMARATALGRLDGAKAMGHDEVWIPPHVGACKSCKRLIENRVFSIDQLRDASNYGRKQADWVPCLPLHPWCRHTAVPWVSDVYEEAQQEYARMRDAGLDEEALEEMFDSSGQLRPQYANDERLQGVFAGKTIRDPFEHLLGETIAKVRTRGVVVKGFFDPPQLGLDPLVWNEEELKPEVRSAILDFWQGVLGDGWQSWARVFITGSATSYQWGTGWKHPWLGSHQQPTYPDVDTHLVIDYELARNARPLWTGMTPMELRKLIEAWSNRAKVGVEVAPGLRLDAYVRMEATEAEFEQDISRTGQGVYDVIRDRWLIPPTKSETGEVYGQRPLGGLGGRLAESHPEWVADAEASSARLEQLLNAYRAEPNETTLTMLQEFMDVLYEDRSVGFLEGAGQQDHGNFVWAWLTNFGALTDAKTLLHEIGEAQ